MSESKGNEFWRSIPPIKDVFKPDAKPEAYISNAATDDMKYYVPFSETVCSRPLWISPSENKWADSYEADGYQRQWGTKEVETE